VAEPAEGGFDADADDPICCIKHSSAGLPSLSLSGPFPVGLLPISGRGFEEPYAGESRSDLRRRVSSGSGVTELRSAR